MLDSKSIAKDPSKTLFHEVFEGLSQPVGVCDPEGHMLFMNMVARRFLGVEADDVGDVVLRIDERDTLSTMKLGAAGGGLEFFMADVSLSHSPKREHVSISLQPLQEGGFRVLFLEEDTRQESPSSRMLYALGQISDHVQLFGKLEQLLSLLSSSLADTFPKYAFRIELKADGGSFHVEHPYLEQPQRSEVAEIKTTLPRPLRHELLWSASRAGYHLTLTPDSGDAPSYRLQIETTRSRGLSDAEREAVLIFMQFLQFFCQRQQSRQSSDSLSNRLDLFTPLFDQLEAAVVLCDARRIIRSCNEPFLQLVGAQGQRVDGVDVIEFFEPEYHAPLRAAAAAAMSGVPPAPLEVSWEVVAGTSIVLQVKLAPLQSQSTSAVPMSSRGFILIAQPTQANLEQLEQKFAQADHLMELGQLATGVAHELKNPLTSILNYADYLLQKYRDHLFEQRDKERLVRIIEGVEHIDHFVRDLLTIAKPESTGAVPERLQMHEVLRRAAKLCEPAFEACGARLALSFASTAPFISGLEGQLVQVFVNLLDNAASALPEAGGEVTLTTYQEAETLVVCVEDTGCGMNADQMEHMFEPFYTTKRSTGGTGLGLVLVQSIVSRHQGTIDVKSTQGEGTSFILRFPLLVAEV